MKKEMKSAELQFVEKFLGVSKQEQWDMTVTTDVNLSIVSKLLPGFDFDKVLTEYASGLEKELMKKFRSDVLVIEKPKASSFKSWPIFEIYFAFETHFSSSSPHLKFSIVGDELFVNEGGCINIRASSLAITNGQIGNDKRLKDLVFRYRKIADVTYDLIQAGVAIKKSYGVLGGQFIVKANPILNKFDIDTVKPMSKVNLKENREQIYESIIQLIPELLLVLDRIQVEINEVAQRNLVVTVETFNSVVRDNCARAFESLNSYHKEINLPELTLNIKDVLLDSEDYTYSEKYSFTDDSIYSIKSEIKKIYNKNQELFPVKLTSNSISL